MKQRRDARLSRELLIAGESRFTFDLQIARIIIAKLARFACTRALHIHRRLKSFGVNGQATFTCDIRRQVHRETIGIIKSEHRITGNDRPLQR